MTPSPHDVRLSEDATRRRVSKKLVKKRKEGHQPTMELPDRLKNIADDGEEDVVPQQGGNQMFMNMNQSIFGLIAAAGSNVDFNDRFEGQSSDEDDGDDDNAPVKHAKGKGKEQEDVAKTQVLKKSSSDKKHMRRISGQLLRSLPQLPRLSTKSKSKSSKLKNPPHTAAPPGTDGSSSPNIDSSGSKSPNIEITGDDRENRLAPVMSRMLEARAEMTARPSFDLERLSGEQRRGVDDDGGDSALARQLKDIFEFDHAEKVLEGIVTQGEDHGFWKPTLT
jgi:sterol 3beta-glucosyltransferase